MTVDRMSEYVSVTLIFGFGFEVGHISEKQICPHQSCLPSAVNTAHPRLQKERLALVPCVIGPYFVGIWKLCLV